MKVNVTQYDIETGTRQSSMFCPVAYAIKAAFNTKQVYVMDDRVRINDKTFRLAPEAQAFIKSFDAWDSVEPFEFNIDREGDRML